MATWLILLTPKVHIHISSKWWPIQCKLCANVNRDVDCHKQQVQSKCHPYFDASISVEMKWLISDEKIGMCIEVRTQRALFTVSSSEHIH